MNLENHILPDWPAPGRVRALSTTRKGGFSKGAWSSLNLGDRCGDDREHVRANRDLLRSVLPAEPRWLRQVHGTSVAGRDSSERAPEADASVTSEQEQVLAILTADCLAVLFCDEDGTFVAAAHAGWRGLAGGVLDRTVEKIPVVSGKLMAWLSPAIGPGAYEVGDDVVEAFESYRGPAGSVLLESFSPSGDKWNLDMAGAARSALNGLGIGRVYGGNWCTYSDPGRFYSYRRDGITGRMASLIWLEPVP